MSTFNTYVLKSNKGIVSRSYSKNNNGAKYFWHGVYSLTSLSPYKPTQVAKFDDRLARQYRWILPPEFSLAPSYLCMRTETQIILVKIIYEFC